MTRKRDRIFAGVMALAFLLTTVGVSSVLVWEVIQESRQNDESAVTTDNTNKIQGTNMEDFTPIAKIDKLEAIDTALGTGQEVKAGDLVTVDYTGAVAATGTVFQSSLDTGQTVTFRLDQVIAGWRDGLVGMKVGGTRRLLIPAVQAYGSTPPNGSGIPVDADLVFDVTLHAIGE